MFSFFSALRQAYKLVKRGFTAYEHSIQNPLHFPQSYPLSILLAELKKYRPTNEHMFLDDTIGSADKQFLKGPTGDSK